MYQFDKTSEINELLIYVVGILNVIVGYFVNRTLTNIEREQRESARRDENIENAYKKCRESCESRCYERIKSYFNRRQ